MTSPNFALFLTQSHSHDEGDSSEGKVRCHNRWGRNKEIAGSYEPLNLIKTSRLYSPVVA